MKYWLKAANQDTLLDDKSTAINDKTNKIMASVIYLTGNIYPDLTVKFIFKYFWGNRYILVMYDYAINSIIAELIDKFKDNQSSMHMKHYTKV